MILKEVSSPNYHKSTLEALGLKLKNALEKIKNWRSIRCWSCQHGIFIFLL